MTSPDTRRTLILDLVGTLIDSAVTITSTLNIIRDKEQLPPLDMEAVKPFISLGAENWIYTSGIPLALVPQTVERAWTDAHHRRYSYVQSG